MTEEVTTNNELGAKMELAIRVFSNRTLARNVTMLYIILFSVVTAIGSIAGYPWYITLAFADFMTFILSYMFFVYIIPRTLRYYMSGE